MDEYLYKYHTAGGKNVYYYHGEGNLYETKGYRIKRVMKMKANDIITIKVDCIEWKVSFMRNNEAAGGKDFSIAIQADEVYYPFIGFAYASKDTHYELMVWYFD